MIEHELVDVFIAEADGSMPLDPNPAEAMAVDWITRDDLRSAIAKTPDIFTPWLRIYMTEHAEAIFG